MKIIKRKDIEQILLNWSGNILSTNEVLDWADNRYPFENVDYEDWEGDPPKSVSNEILAHLDSLEMNLVTKDDIPAMIRFLETPIGDFERGFKKWCDYNSSIDIRKRIKELQGIPFYEKFCK
jgi:hypothetical protein